MIKLKILNSNIFDVKSESMILLVGAMSRSMEGAMAENFKKLYPEQWAYIESNMTYPVTRGIYPIQMPDGNPYKLVQLANILNITDASSLPEQQEMLKFTINIAIKNCFRNSVYSLTTGVPTWGKRLSPIDAFQSISNAIESSRKSVVRLDLSICILEKEMYEIIKNYATSIGW